MSFSRPFRLHKAEFVVSLSAKIHPEPARLSYISLNVLVPSNHEPLRYNSQLRNQRLPPYGGSIARQSNQQTKNMTPPQSPLRPAPVTQVAPDRDSRNLVNPSRAGGRHPNLCRLKKQPVCNENEMSCHTTGHTQVQAGTRPKKADVPPAGTRHNAKNSRVAGSSISREGLHVAAVAEQRTVHRVQLQKPGLRKMSCHRAVSAINVFRTTSNGPFRSVSRTSLQTEVSSDRKQQTGRYPSLLSCVPTQRKKIPPTQPRPPPRLRFCPFGKGSSFPNGI